MELNELNKQAMGGTELMQKRLHASISPSILNNFQIIPSRVREFQKGKKHIYWVHDLAQDPEVQHLKNGGWNRFDKIVFVSHWQQQQYHNLLGVPYSAGTVIKNAIEPIETHEKPDLVNNPIRIVYFSTPHRGLDILIQVFSELSKKYDDIELDVISSFGLYGWKERDKPYFPLINFCKRHKKINYYESMPNDQLREHLKTCHIFAYPSTWMETSCLCLIEAMSAGLTCVHSTLGALPETSMHLTMQYDYQEDKEKHAQIFYSNLKNAIDMYRGKNVQSVIDNANRIKMVTDSVFNWNQRIVEWENLLRSLNTR